MRKFHIHCFDKEGNEYLLIRQAVNKKLCRKYLRQEIKDKYYIVKIVEVM